MSGTNKMDKLILNGQNIDLSPDYQNIRNKPTINGVTIDGNKTLDDFGVATKQEVENVSKEVAKLPYGIYYGQYDDVESLPDASQLTQKGYAYIASTDPNIFYIYTYDGESGIWQDSGNKFDSGSLENNLSTKSQTKAPTTKAVQEGIEAIDVTLARSAEDENELTATQKYNASANINNRGVDIVQDTGEINSLGYKILNPNKSFASQVTTPNTIYEIRNRFDLQGQDITLGTNSTLRFNGGQLMDSSANHTGRIRCKKVEAKFSDLGLQPGLSVSETVAKNNLHYLKILEYVENIILSLDDNYTLRSTYETISGSTVSYPAVFNGNLKIEGNNYTLNIYNKTIFEINNNLLFKNCKVVNNDTNTNCVLFYIPNTDDSINKKSDFVLEDCIFEGNIRIITCYRKATTTNYNKGIGLFKVTGCTFNKIYTSSGSNIGIYMDDTLCELAVIENNTVHNLFCQLFSFATSNRTDASSAVYYSGQNGKRVLEINNNTIYNDEDWTPSDESSWRAPVYYTFIVAEGGYIHYSFNSFTNIICKDTSSVVYDSYISSLTLLYENNFIKNVFELSNSTSKVHELLKSKSGGNYQHGLRTYKNNTFIQESINTINERYVLNHPNETAKYAGYIDYRNHFFSELNCKNLTIDNNTFNLNSFYTQKNYRPLLERFVFTNNNFVTKRAIGPDKSSNVYTGSVLFQFQAANIKVINISSNLITMTDNYNPGWESNIVTEVNSIDEVLEFSTETPYSIGDIVSYDGLYYIFDDTHSGEWDLEKVTEINNYSNTTAYTTGTCIIYENIIYKFTSDKEASIAQKLALLAIENLSTTSNNFISVIISNNTFDNVLLAENSAYYINAFIDSNTFKNIHLKPYMFEKLYDCEYNNNIFQINGYEYGSASVAYWFRYTPYFKAKIICDLAAAGKTTAISNIVPSNYVTPSSSTNYCIETLTLEASGETYIFQMLKHLKTNDATYTEDMYVIHATSGELINISNTTSNVVAAYAIMPLNCNSEIRTKFSVSSGSVGDGGVCLYRTKNGFNGFNITKFIANKTFTIEYKNDFYNELPLGKLIPQTYVTNLTNLPSTGENGTAPLFNLQNGTKIYVESLKANAIWNGTDWELEPTKGDSNSRPVLTSGNIGAMYFDTNLGKPIYWNGTAWVDGNGIPLSEIQVSDKSVLLQASASSNTIEVYTNDTPSIDVKNPDDTTATWMSAILSGTTLTISATANTILVAPEFEADTYYSESDGVYTQLSTQPDDWETNYADYYIKEDDIYSAVEGVVTPSSNPRGGKIILTNTTDEVVINVVQNYV